MGELTRTHYRTMRAKREYECEHCKGTVAIGELYCRFQLVANKLQFAPDTKMHIACYRQGEKGYRMRSTPIITMCRQEDIEHQYLLTAKNDGELYRSAAQKLRDGRYFSLVTELKAEYRRIASSLNEEVFISQRDYFVVEMLMYYHQDSAIPSQLQELVSAMQTSYSLETSKSCEPTTNETINAAKPAKGKTMNKINTTPFATRHEIFGNDVSTMSEQDLIESIKQVEKEIATLKEVKTSSTKIKSKVEALEAMLAEIVKVLDSK